MKKLFLLILVCIILLCSCTKLEDFYYDDRLIARNADSCATEISVSNTKNDQYSYWVNKFTGSKTLMNRKLKNNSLEYEFTLTDGLGKLVLIQDNKVTVLADKTVGPTLITGLTGKFRVKVVGIAGKIDTNFKVI